MAKPRNLQWHTYPKNPIPPSTSKQQGNLQKITGQANSAITNLKGKGKDKICVVCANGPSLAEAPLDRLKGVPGVEFIAINIPDPRVWPTQYWILLDSVTMHRTECAPFVPDYQGLVITNHTIKKGWNFRHMIRVLVRGGDGLSRDMLNGLCLGRGRASGFVALQIALYMGYKDIYFFGLDMGKSEDGELYPYGENTAVDAEKRLQAFESDASSWTTATAQLTPEEREHIYICSEFNRWPFVKEFRRLSPAQGVEKILGPAKVEEPEATKDAADEANPSL